MRPAIVRRISGSILLILLANAVMAAGKKPAQKNKDTIFNTTSILKIMERVGDWQLQSWKTDGFKHKKTDWTNAALYTGLFDLNRVSGDEKYDQALIAIGNDVKWNTGSNRLLADDYCIGQTYSLLYMRYKQPEMI